jgi:hypothetical protein
MIYRGNCNFELDDEEIEIIFKNAYIKSLNVISKSLISYNGGMSYNGSIDDDFLSIELTLDCKKSDIERKSKNKSMDQEFTNLLDEIISRGDLNV